MAVVGAAAIVGAQRAHPGAHIVVYRTDDADAVFPRRFSGKFKMRAGVEGAGAADERQHEILAGHVLVVLLQ